MNFLKQGNFTFPLPICNQVFFSGSDVYRSLFLFEEGRPLGKKGLEWLKIHVINLTGLKKRASNEERLAFADEVSKKTIIFRLK